MVVVWELTGAGKGQEKKALRLIGRRSLRWHSTSLCSRRNACPGRPARYVALGMLWLGTTFFACCFCAGESKIGEKMDNPVLITEWRVTMIDAYLAGSFWRADL